MIQFLLYSLCLLVQTNGGFIFTTRSKSPSSCIPNRSVSPSSTSFHTCLYASRSHAGKRGRTQLDNNNNNNTRTEKHIPALLGLLLSFLLVGLSPIIPSSNTHITTADAATAHKTNKYEATFDHLVGTINNMYYDTSSGYNFSPPDFYNRYKLLKIYSKEGARGIRSSPGKVHRPLSEQSPWQLLLSHVHILGDDTILLIDSSSSQHTATQTQTRYWDFVGNKVPSQVLSDSTHAVQGLKWLVSSLGDPYSKYVTREELQEEMHSSPNDGFLGLGMFVQSTDYAPMSYLVSAQDSSRIPPLSTTRGPMSRTHAQLSPNQAKYLPIVTAVTPDSPAERAGIVVGDKIVSIGSDSFLSMTSPDQVYMKLTRRYSASNYVGYPTLVIARPVYHTIAPPSPLFSSSSSSSSLHVAHKKIPTTSTYYRLSKVRLPTKSLQDPTPFVLVSNTPQASTNDIPVSSNTATPTIPYTHSISGGNDIVHYQLLTSQDSIFEQENDDMKCGYIRLTRFSRESTRGFVEAVQALEAANAQVYIIDLRNNYGGIFQEALLTATSLLYDPHAVLCYTLNSRGGFTPHDVEEFLVDTRYPGYLLSNESPNMLLENRKHRLEEWTPPSSYASFHEQRIKRGIHVAYETNPTSPLVDNAVSFSTNDDVIHQRAQKKIVLLVNEGTASSAEVFASALRDNGRTVAVVGTKTFGKGLIQHNFAMPGGGALRLTVAEYLTPKLQHVTKVGNSRYDPQTGVFVGGGIRPDVYCPSEGIPSNIGADYCVGKALDILGTAQQSYDNQLSDKSIIRKMSSYLDEL